MVCNAQGRVIFCSSNQPTASRGNGYRAFHQGRFLVQGIFIMAPQSPRHLKIMVPIPSMEPAHHPDISLDSIAIVFFQMPCFDIRSKSYYSYYTAGKLAQKYRANLLLNIYNCVASIKILHLFQQMSPSTFK
ncbi:hypothetical protein XELAEV_18010890mg [Xenopus laevis]|uniref:Uncharacterized protein n=1 Tax=Xenopus laevis TaxID=8355 RepID=A0A974DV47_XENLA|nr:hypothetical protein XELAEV_18010890mg [Xenopus laevis]